MVDIALGGLGSHLTKKLESFVYNTLNALQLRAMNQDYKFKNSKDVYKTHRSNTHVVDYDSVSSSDEEKEVYVRGDPNYNVCLVGTPGGPTIRVM